MLNQKVAGTPTQTRERTLKIIITEKAVRSSEVAAYARPGYRPPHDLEVSQAWLTDPAFQKRLYALPYGIWTYERGLNTSGPHKIRDDGTHIRTTKPAFNKLAPKQRSWHYKGGDRVAMGGLTISYGGRALFVSGSVGPEGIAIVAYVKDESYQPKIKNILRVPS
jgi:hypothetical protein